MAKQAVRQYFSTCDVCGLELHSCAVRACPDRSTPYRNIASCIYCCRKCKYHTYEKIGEGCRLKEREEKEKTAI